MTERKVLPITPSEATKIKIESIPDEVIQAFNNLILTNLDQNGNAHVFQDDVVKEIKRLMNIDSADNINNKWLDVEDIYREAGWLVRYDKPGYCETYRAYFVFDENKKL